MTDGTWRIRVDTGGTFTDGWARRPDGRVERAKVLSSGVLRAQRTGGPDDAPTVTGTWTRSPRSAIGLRVVDAAGAVVAVPAAGGSGDPGGVRVVAAEPAGTGTGTGTGTATGTATSFAPGDASGDASGSDTVGGGTAPPSVRLRLDAPLPPGTGPNLALVGAESAPVVCARVLTDTAPGTPLPACDLRLATTRATNALLEGRGGRVGLIVTAGFEDLERIGDQRRPDLFARVIRRAPSLVTVIEPLGERVLADGRVERMADPDELAAIIARLRAAKVDSVAVCLLHAARWPVHERAVAATLAAAGFERVVVSADLGVEGFVDRLGTVATAAFVAPVMATHLDEVQSAAGPDARLAGLTSSGELQPAARFAAVDALLSGPAGGVAGAAAVARAAGCSRAVGFDMGGTSTDVCRIEGEPVIRSSHRVGHGTVLRPACAIETVAAGGGSICRWGAGGPRVGPESAGAAPGPACHGAGGPLTVTDAALLLGRLVPERFPFPPDEVAAAAAADRVLAEARIEAPGLDRDTMLDGFCAIAADAMAAAIRTVTVREGWDPADHALVAFGGAGGQHAGPVAERLGMRTILLPADASILSAVGLDAARPSRTVTVAVAGPLEAPDAHDDPMTRGWDQALGAARTALRADGATAFEIAAADAVAEARVQPRRGGAALDVVAEAPEAAGAAARVRAAWIGRYRAVFGTEPAADVALDLESVTVRLTVPPIEDPTAGAPDSVMESTRRPAAPITDVRLHRVHVDGAWRAVPVHERDDLVPGTSMSGPVMIVDDRTTVLLARDWVVHVAPGGDLRAEPNGGAAAATSASPEPTAAPRPAPSSAIRRELTAGRIRAIATDMGEQLRRTAVSVNVRDRLDYSCGVLDANGRLLASAPHVPVHLGALGACVRAVLADDPPGPGDVVVVNHPAFGGSHLPDVTVIAPVHAGGERIAFVAARAHHAEIGGRRPGSMAPFARHLAEEGVVIPPRRLVAAGEDRFASMAEQLASGPWPSRGVDENIADLRAQVAACHRGVSEVRALARRLGAGAFAADAAAIPPSTARLVQEALAGLGGGRARSLSAADRLDDGTPLQVRIDLPADPRHERVRIDFAGTGDVHPGALNAPRAVTAAAVAYVLRLLVDRDLSLDDGLLEAVDLHVPPGLLNPSFVADPAACPAVAGGNVETSQRAVDVLIAAFGLGAASQGTMNNVLFGPAAGGAGTYETLGGGAGGGPLGPGASGVHVHMTNTALTDPEILERTRPVVLERFGFRRGSGGAGVHPGGDGLERIWRFAEPVRVTLLGQRRTVPPPGADGGAPGQPGEQWVMRAGGDREPLAGLAEAELTAGDRLVVRTPGGGGWGAPPASSE